MKALRLYELEVKGGRSKKLSFAPSQASWTNVMEAATRRRCPLVPGLLFKDLQTYPTALQPHKWPLNSLHAEDEEQGYPSAMAWLQQNVCPPGVQAVLVDKQTWLEW